MRLQRERLRTLHFRYMCKPLEWRSEARLTFVAAEKYCPVPYGKVFPSRNSGANQPDLGASMKRKFYTRFAMLFIVLLTLPAAGPGVRRVAKEPFREPSRMHRAPSFRTPKSVSRRHLPAQSRNRSRPEPAFTRFHRWTLVSTRSRSRFRVFNIMCRRMYAWTPCRCSA